MMFWFAVLCLAGVAGFTMLVPVLRRGEKAQARHEYALEIFEDQLAEVDRDEQRGLISGPEAQAARTEIKRRMLSAGKTQADRGSAPQSAALLVIAAIVIPLAGAGLYTVTGTPGMPSIPFAERSEEQNEAREINTLTSRLRQRLDEDPNGGEAEGWELLAVTYMRMNRYSDAAYAFEKLTQRDDATSGDFSRLAEALITAENGIVTPRAQAAVDRARALDPQNPAGTYYAAIALDQAGQTLDGRKLLLDRIAAASQLEPWMDVFLQQANRMGAGFGLDPVSLPPFAPAVGAAPSVGPSVEDVEAAGELSEEDRSEFIRSMVTRLSDRLQDNPDDLDGWLQLARARLVLGETDLARDALIAAKRLSDALPDDDPKRQMVESGLEQLQ